MLLEMRVSWSTPVLPYSVAAIVFQYAFVELLASSLVCGLLWQEVTATSLFLHFVQICMELDRYEKWTNVVHFS